MPYEVGNLQIVFNAVDDTSKAFDKLASNLKAVKKAIFDIGNIGKADLNKFGEVILDVQTKFKPFLTDIKGASKGLVAFNEATKRLGINKAAEVADEFNRVANAIDIAANASDNLDKSIKQGTEDIPLNINNASQEYENFGRVISRTEIVAKRLATALTTHTYDRLSKEVSGLASQWKNLYATMQKSSMYDRLTDGLFSESASDRLKEITQSYLAQKQEMEKVNAAFQEMENNYRRTKMSTEELAVDDYKVAEAERKKRIEFLQTLKATGRADLWTKQYAKDLKRLQKEQGDTTKRQNKLLASIKRVAIYRLIRAGLSQITGSIRDSVTAYARLDSSIYNTMSSLKTSITAIKTSFGAVVLPILQAIEPVVKQIAVGFANMANVISASMSKTGQYAKINTERLLAFGDAANLLDFDKFRTLSQDDSVLEIANVEDLNQELGLTKAEYEGIYFFISSIGDLLKNVLDLVNRIGSSTTFKTVITVVTWVVGGLVKAVSWLIEILNKSGLIEPILWGILGALIAIGVTKLITWFTSGNFVKAFTTLISKLKLTKDGINGIVGSTQLLAASIGALIGSIAYLASNWSQLNSTQKLWIPLASTLIGLAVGVGTALVLSITAIKEALKLNPAAIAKAAITAALFTAAAGIAIGTAISTTKNAANAEVAKMAVGGSPQVGTMFFAGEAGAETVTVGNSGRTEVTNVYQMEEALYNALVRYGRENRGSDSAININIDGTKVFEVTRRTANKRGLDFTRI